MSSPLLQVTGLELRYNPSDPAVLRLLDFLILPGELLAVVGESGSGKSSLVAAVTRLSRAFQLKGSILFQGQELLDLPFARMQKLRQRGIAVLLQETGRALNPVFRVGRQLEEVLRFSGRLRGLALRQQQRQLWTELGLEAEQLHYYPHQLSGGMRQRVLLALALAQQPRLLVADEPTTALDLQIEQQIVALFRRYVAEGSSLLLVSHDLELIKSCAQRVLVLYAGLVVEEGEVGQLLSKPQHPYTQGLLASTNLRRQQQLPVIRGAEANPGSQGCPFALRCPLAYQRCWKELPLLQTTHAGWKVRCWRAGQQAYV